MAVGYDGSIRINTKIDTAGAEAGLKTLTNSLKRFAAEVAIAFSVGAIVHFGKSCVKLASDLQEIQNVVEVTFGKNSALINDFAKNAITQFGLSELAAKKYASSIGAMGKAAGIATAKNNEMSTTITGLIGDFASFRNISQDEAYTAMASIYTGETESLKRYGILITETNLQEFARTQGIAKSIEKMTQQEKIMLRYNYILAVTSDAQGDFVRTQGSWANQVRLLSGQFDQLKATLGASFIAILTPVLKMINSILSSLNAAATVFANFISAVTGTAQTATTAVAATTAATEGLTDATDANAESTTAAGAAAKKASKSLAGFDDLNVLTDTNSESSSSETTTTTATVDASNSLEKSFDDTKTKMTEFFGKYQEEIGRVKAQWETLKETVSGIFEDLGKQFKRVDIKGSAFKAILNFLYSIEAAANLVIGVIGNLFVALNVPTIIQSAFDFLGAAFKAIGDAIVAITPGVMAFVNTALVPIAQWIGGKIADAFNFLAEQFTKIGDWFTSHKEDFTILGQKLGEVAAAIWKLIEPILDTAWDLFKKAISDIIDVLLKLGDWVMNNKQLVVNFLTVFTAFKAIGFVKEIMSIVGSFVKLTVEMLVNNAQWLILKGHLIATTAEMLLNNVQWAVMWVKLQLANKELIIANAQWLIAEIRMKAALAISILLNSQIIITGLKLAIVVAGVLLLIGLVSKIQENWKNMSTVERVISVLGALAIAASVAAVAFGALQSAWSLGLAAAAIAAGTLMISGALSSAKSDAASQMTSSIPRLAQGAVIPPNREFIATLGDQKSGRNLEAPEGLIREIIDDALSNFGGGGTTNVNFTGSLSQLARVLHPRITREDDRRGPSLVNKGVT